MAKNQKAIRSYDPDKRKERKLIDVARGLSKIHTWALSPDDKRLVLVDSKQAIIVQDVVTGRASTVAQPVPGRTMIDKISFSPDGNSMALLLRQGLEIWNAADLSVRVQGLPALDAPWSFAFHPRAPYFAAANADRDLTLFDLDTGKPVRSFNFRLGQWTRHVVFAPDGSSCAACGGEDRFAVFEVDP
jgi:WD40 repeat protein